MRKLTFSRESIAGTALGDWVDELLRLHEERFLAELRLNEEQFRSEVQARTRAKNVLTVLRIRNLPVNQDEQAMVAECRDPDLLELWFTRAVTATTTAEVFAEPTGVHSRDTNEPTEQGN